jgi:hypothetical protein
LPPRGPIQWVPSPPRRRRPGVEDVGVGAAVGHLDVLHAPARGDAPQAPARRVLLARRRAWALSVHHVPPRSPAAPRPPHARGAASRPDAPSPSSHEAHPTSVARSHPSSPPCSRRRLLPK